MSIYLCSRGGKRTLVSVLCETQGDAKRQHCEASEKYIGNPLTIAHWEQILSSSSSVCLVHVSAITLYLNRPFSLSPPFQLL